VKLATEKPWNTGIRATRRKPGSPQRPTSKLSGKFTSTGARAHALFDADAAL